ncbi:MAG: hypothetical protein MRY86_09300, partial [Phaeodactylibacter sp.]|nr:hypothetical protein [Phaeodactylibacter sp.]
KAQVWQGLAPAKLDWNYYFTIIDCLKKHKSTGGAFITPNVTSLISLKGEKVAGEALGIQKSTDSLGQVIGPIIGSWLLTLNTFLPYLLTGIMVLLVAGYLLISKKIMILYGSN